MQTSLKLSLFTLAMLSALAAGTSLLTLPAAGKPAAKPVPAPPTSQAQAPPKAASPRSVQVKFEWISASSEASETDPDKGVEALTVMAQEGKTAQVSSQHSKNGVGQRRSVTVLPRVGTDGLISLLITERNETSANGETKADSSQTTVRVKSGDTGLVHGLVSSGGQSQDRMLFVTPSIVRTTW